MSVYLLAERVIVTWVCVCSPSEAKCVCIWLFVWFDDVGQVGLVTHKSRELIMRPLYEIKKRNSVEIYKINFFPSLKFYQVV